MLDYENAIRTLDKRIEERWGNMEFNTSVDIHSLLDARVHFTALYAYLGEKQNVCYREYKLAENSRKRAFIDAQVRLIEEGNSATAAKVKAEKEIKDEYEKEIEADSEFHLWKCRRESCKETLSTLGQLIGVVRSEREQSENQHLK